MTDLFKEVIIQIPSLAVLCYLVYEFLRHLRIYHAIIKEINEENMNARRLQADVIRENTQVVASNTASLKHFQDELNRYMTGT